MRTAAFQSEYDVAYDTLNDTLSNASLHTIMAHRRDELQKICAGSNLFYNPLSLAQ